MEAEGASAIFARHETCAAAARAGLYALGFELFADPAHFSRTVTAARVPEGFDWKAINGAVKAEGVVLAGGQGPLTGQIFRLGHLGSVTLGEILDAIGVLEEVSIRFERAGPARSRDRGSPGRRPRDGWAIGPTSRAAVLAGGVDRGEDPRGRTRRGRGPGPPARAARGR